MVMIMLWPMHSQLRTHPIFAVACVRQVQNVTFILGENEQTLITKTKSERKKLRQDARTTKHPLNVCVCIVASFFIFFFQKEKNLHETGFGET